MGIVEKEHVPSGSFRTEKKKPLLLQAFLGTCVGVALYDKTSGTGGIIHILLPEPPTGMAPESPEKYASTGLPMFLDELKQTGVDFKNLCATIAGGALVGPVSFQDINLDIGGRSADIAVSILEKEKIKILKAETGGFFTCTLELNMLTGETAIKPAELEYQGADSDYSIPSRDDIAGTIEALQPIPQAALKIMRMIRNDNHEISDITNELSKDQVLSARTLQICNSAFFAGRVEIETLTDAVLLLGESMLAQSILTAAVNSYYNQAGSTGYSLCKGGLFFHALGCAVASERIASMTKAIPPEKAYTAGLLHDIGKVVLDQYVARIHPMFFREINNKRGDSLDVEKKYLGTDHCYTGAFLAKKWNLPMSIMETILFHHTPGKAVNRKKTVSIVYIANILMSIFSTKFEMGKANTKKLETALDTIGLGIADIPLLIDTIPLEVFNSNGIKL